jgi:hypothetical protein
MTMILEGGCLCEAIRYRITERPLYSVVCHCQSCRRSNGAMAVAWITVARADFRFISGFPQAYQSSHGVVRKFCKACGSSMTYENAGSAETVDITTATLDRPQDFPPRQEVWIEHRISWQPVNPTLRQFGRGMTHDPDQQPASG